MGSPIAEGGLALFEEGQHAFDRIGSLEGEGAEVGFDFEAVLQREGQTAMDGVAGEAQGTQAVAGHFAGEVRPGIEEIAFDDTVEEADPLGFLGLDRAAGQMISSARASRRSAAAGVAYPHNLGSDRV